MQLKDVPVLITGGGSGLGAATARAMAAKGAKVSVLDVRKEHADAVAAEVNGLALGADVTNEEQVKAAIAKAEAAHGIARVLVNCAGVAHGGPVDEVTEALWDETLDANLKGTFFCIQSALPFLRMAKGNVVNLASDAGLIGEVGLAVYCASKGGVVNLTRALALELAPEVRVNCVCPGYVDTDMVRRDVIEASPHPQATEAALAASAPLNRIAGPDEIATAILYLASHAARFVTGAALQIDGGTTAGHPRRP